jgi:hypothetical protein
MKRLVLLVIITGLLCAGFWLARRKPAAKPKPVAVCGRPLKN